MKRSIKKIVSIITSIALVSSLSFIALPNKEVKASNSTNGYQTSDSSEANEYNLCENIKDGAILHAWCWSFNAIKASMKDIAEAGFTAVQTSPINACCDRDTTMKIFGGDNISGKGGIWWFQYQPEDWTIGNYIVGTEEEFKSMCYEADKYGIKIIVDVVPNHTTTDTAHISQNLINAAGGWDKLYHAYNQDIKDYNNRYECTLGKASSCNDVNTENPKYQDYFIKYLNQCIADGADGFRYDTAKHIGLPSDPLDEATKSNVWNNNFWLRVTSEITDASRIFNYLEVLNDTNVKETEYSNYGSVTASDYGEVIRNKVGAKDISKDSISSYNPYGRYYASSSKSVTWVESHDTFCDGKSEWLNDWQIKMGWAIITARQEGTPLFFDRPDGSNSSNKWGNNVLGAKGCDLFKDPEVAAVNKFRNAMVGEQEYLRNINGSSQILAIERGNKGEVIVNLGNDVTINNHDTNLSDGTYFDKVSGEKFSVANGKLSGTIKGGKITVLYQDNKLSVSSSKNDCSFKGALDLKLAVSNADSATYSINGKENISYTNGTVIRIGENSADNEIINVTLTAIKGDNTAVKTYTYTKIPDDATMEVYFDKPDSWGTPYVYIYDDTTSSTVITNGDWPGIEMTKNDNGLYSVTLSDEWFSLNAKVIFTDNKIQIPKANNPGLEMTSYCMIYKDGTWSKYVKGKSPSVSISTESCEFVDSLNLTLGVKNATNATYTIDNNEPVNYVNGTTINIGKNSNIGDTIKVTLYASLDSKADFKTFSYVKVKKEEGKVVFFQKPAGWEEPYVYIYDDTTSSTVQMISPWPGSAMTSIGDNLYSFTLPESWNSLNAKVIFTDKKIQVPGSGKAGFSLTSEKMIYEEGIWQDYTKVDLEPIVAYFVKPDNWGTPYIYVYDDRSGSVKMIEAWPGVEMKDEGNKLYSYSLPSVWKYAKVIFTDKKIQTPVSGAAGFELTKSMIYENGVWKEV